MDMNQPSNFMPTPDQDVLDVKPLRMLAPMFPAPFGANTFNQSTTPPFVLVTPAWVYLLLQVCAGSALAAVSHEGPQTDRRHGTWFRFLGL
jgi:hypothetical protein